MQSAAEVKYSIMVVQEYMKRNKMNIRIELAMIEIIKAAQSWADERTV